MLNRLWTGLPGGLKQQPLRVVAAVAFVAVLAFACVAAERGRIEGAVSDQTGAKISGARVIIHDRTGAVIAEARSDDGGQFKINDVAAGRYNVTAEATGFTQAAAASVDVPASGAASVSLRLDVAALADRVVVSATRTLAQSSELGGPVDVITADDLRRGNQSLVSESLRLSPGLVVAQTGGRGGITSVFTRGGESDYNKVLIDGVPVNSAGGLFDFAPLTTENLDRIEVVRGPGSALFGSDAMTSVIQLVTRRGASSVPEFEFSGEGGSFDFHREAARLAGRNGRFDYATGFGFQSTDGRFRNSDYINRSASANLGFRLTDEAELRVTSRWNNGTLGVPGPTAILFVDPDERQKHRDIALSAGLEWRVTPRVNQTMRFIFAEFETFNFDPAAQDLTRPDTPLLPPFAFGVDFATSFRDHEKRAGFQYQATAALGSANVLTGGVDFEHESGVFDDGFSRVSPVRNNLGVYLQDQLAWRERVFVTAGVRVERNTASLPADLRAALTALGSSVPNGDVGFGTSANPKLAASLLARRHREGASLGATRIRASFGTGIKEPRLLEAFSPSLFFLGNPALNPERATSFDVGVSQEFLNRRASLEATYFDNHFRDQIAFIFDPLTFGPVRLDDGTLTNFVNVERSTARGLELAGAARPLRQLRLAASYTFLRSRLERAQSVLNPELGLPLLRRPRHAGTVEASWVAERWDVTLDGSFIGRRRDIDPVSGVRFDASGRAIYNDGYAKLNLSGSYRITGGLRAFARVENLLNQDYQEVLGFPAYRLNFSAGLRVQVGGR
ncbi:MAG TPA: TonB-dependent receptor [Blastocatellia bacterium]|nr:TonB-dependent receptor [Blastocatellia bacterium]